MKSLSSQDQASETNGTVLPSKSGGILRCLGSPTNEGKRKKRMMEGEGAQCDYRCKLHPGEVGVWITGDVHMRTLISGSLPTKRPTKGGEVGGGREAGTSESVAMARCP